MDPNRYVSLVNKGVCLSRMDRFEEALVCYNKALELKPNSFEALVNKGNCLRGLGKPKEALKNYDKAIKINTKNEYVKNLRKSCFESLKATRLHVPASIFEKK